MFYMDYTDNLARFWIWDAAARAWRGPYVAKEALEEAEVIGDAEAPDPEGRRVVTAAYVRSIAEYAMPAARLRRIAKLACVTPDAAWDLITEREDASRPDWLALSPDERIVAWVRRRAAAAEENV